MPDWGPNQMAEYQILRRAIEHASACESDRCQQASRISPTGEMPAGDRRQQSARFLPTGEKPAGDRCQQASSYRPAGRFNRWQQPSRFLPTGKKPAGVELCASGRIQVRDCDLSQTCRSDRDPQDVRSRLGLGFTHRQTQVAKLASTCLSDQHP